MNPEMKRNVKQLWAGAKTHKNM